MNRELVGYSQAVLYRSLRERISGDQLKAQYYNTKYLAFSFGRNTAFIQSMPLIPNTQKHLKGFKVK